jgi:pilus assembly protein CpaE
MFGTAANNGQMIAELSANHRITRTFQQMTRRLTGRSEPRKESFLSPIINKLRVRRAS